MRGGEVDLSVHSQEGFLSKHEAPGVKVESGRGDTGSKPGKPGTGQPGAPWSLPFGVGEIDMISGGQQNNVSKGIVSNV